MRPVSVAIAAVLLVTGCQFQAPLAPEREDSPDAAAAFYAMKRGITAKSDSGRLYAAARAGMQQMRRYSTVGDVVESRGRLRVDSSSTRTLATWTPLGPGNIGGRTRALVFDPVEPRIVYSGAVSGGVWKSVDSGADWAAAGDLLSNLAVNSLAIDPRDRFTLFAGTGEGYYREDVRGTALPIRGDGIFVTHDGGASWSQLPATAGNADFQWVNDLVISPHDSSRLYAATRSGVWRSLDRGTSWSSVLPTTVKGGCTDLAIRSDTDGDYLFAACGIFEQSTVYRNTNAERGGGWTAVLSEPGMSRTSLAIAPSNPSIVYALAASNTPGPSGDSQDLQAVYRSDQNGDPGTWTPRVTFGDPTAVNRVLLSNPLGALCENGVANWVPMGWHCNVIAVDPKNPERVWAAGVDLFRSDDGGRNWGIASYWWISPNAAQFVHADQHVIAFDPRYDGTTNQTLWVANDGGVYRTANANAMTATLPCRAGGGFTWTSLDHGYAATQFYHGAVFPDGRHLAGGAQDNGTVISDTRNGIDGWTRAYGGDGGYVVVDPLDPSRIYAESQYANIALSTNGGSTFHSVTLPGSGDENQFLFVTPLVLDPNDHTRLWTGGNQLWHLNVAGNFVAASAALPAKVSAIAIAPSSSDLVIAGTSDGHIVRSTSATTSTGTSVWSAAQPRSGYVSSVAFDPRNPNLAWATYAGFGGTHVWKSIDAGQSWSPSDGADDGALPDLPTHSIVVDPTRNHRLYLGTDLGVFVSLDDGAHWLIENSGFAAVITEFLTIGPGPYGTSLYAFTHGRGVWRAELNPPGRRRMTR